MRKVLPFLILFGCSSTSTTSNIPSQQDMQDAEAIDKSFINNDASVSKNMDSSTSSTVESNSCATPNASYLVSFTELSGGTCGPITSSIINFNADGEVPLTTPEKCVSSTEMNCVLHNTDCVSMNQGYTITVTSEITWLGDGSSANGLETITSVGNGQSCVSTYNVSFVRQ